MATCVGFHLRELRVLGQSLTRSTSWWSQRCRRVRWSRGFDVKVARSKKDLGSSFWMSQHYSDPLLRLRRVVGYFFAGWNLQQPRDSRLMESQLAGERCEVALVQAEFRTLANTAIGILRGRLSRKDAGMGFFNASRHDGVVVRLVGQLVTSDAGEPAHDLAAVPTLRYVLSFAVFGQHRLADEDLLAVVAGVGVGCRVKSWTR